MKAMTLRVLVMMSCLLLANAAARAAESAAAQPPLVGPALARDAAGRLYLAAHADDKTVFLHQLDPEGSVLRTTALDGFAQDAPLALAVSPAGEAVLVGSGGGDAIIARVSADGSLVSRATFGGKGLDAALAVALDAEGNAWVAGRTASADLRAEGRLTGATDAFVAELDSAGSVLYATYLSGPQDDEARGVALDKEGAVYVTGRLGRDAFLAKLAPKSGTFVFTTPFGDVRDDVGAAVAVSPSGDVIIAGTTRLPDAPLESEAFVATFDAASGALISSTHLGRAGGEAALALAVDRRGAAWIAGTRGADAFVSRINPDHRESFAGEAEDIASGLVVDGNGDAWVAGLTRSHELPTTLRREPALGGEVFVARLASDTSSFGACPGTKNFTGASSLDWGTGTNWSGGTVPVAADDVCISGFNVVVASGSHVAGTIRVQSGSLTISSATGTLTVDGASEINGPLTISSGTLTGAGNLTVSGLFTWTGGTVSGSGSLTTNGTVSLGGGSPKTLLGRAWTTNATVTWTGTGQVTLSSGAVINNPSTWDCQGIAQLAGGTFNNTGTVKRSTAAGASSFQTSFVHTGSMLVQAGTLDMASGSSTGSFDVAAGSKLQFSSGVFNVNAGTTFTGSGTVAYTGAVLLVVNTPITMPATLTIEQSGTLGGTATLTIGGTFNWSTGTMQDAGITTCNGPVNILGAGAKQINVRTLNLNSGAVFSGTGNLTAGQAAIINSPGTFDCQNDATLSAGAGTLATFNNTGTFKKSAGAGTTLISFNFVNSGAVLVQSGSLNLSGIDSCSGSFDLGAGHTLQISLGSLALNAGTTFTGTGSILHSGGNLNINAAIAIPSGITLGMTGGFQQGTGTLTLAGPFNWSGGSLVALGTTTCNGAVNVSGSAALTLSQRVLNTNATTTYTGTGTLALSIGAKINNGGTWDAQSDVTLVQAGGALPLFTNAGTLRRSASAGAMTVGIPFTNSGTVDVQTGTLSMASYTQTAGITKLTGGSFSSGANIAISGGTLAGSGTVNGPVVVSGTGALAPGLSAGTLSLGSSYTQQAPNGAFNVEIGGLNPGTQHDRVDVTGTAILGGVLNVSLIGGFVPAQGDTFMLMTYGSRAGTFTVNLPAVPCISWQVNYQPNWILLVAAAPQAPTEIVQLTSTDKTTLTWAAGSAAGIVYDVVRGNLGTLPVGPGAGETCLAPGSATTQADAATPAAGAGFWYVVRGRVPACTTGTYGFDSGGIERISTACP